jgi:hypothetical protein
MRQALNLLRLPVKKGFLRPFQLRFSTKSDPKGLNTPNSALRLRGCRSQMGRRVNLVGESLLLKHAEEGV